MRLTFIPNGRPGAKLSIEGISTAFEEMDLPLPFMEEKGGKINLSYADKIPKAAQEFLESRGKLVTRVIKTRVYEFTPNGDENNNWRNSSMFVTELTRGLVDKDSRPYSIGTNSDYSSVEIFFREDMPTQKGLEYLKSKGKLVEIKE